jgi:hypothetical protein
MRAIEKDPRRRYPSASAMRQALELYLASKPSAPRADDVAAVLQNIFEDQREAVRRKIREFMTRGPSAEMATASVNATDSMRVPILTSGAQACRRPRRNLIVAAPQARRFLDRGGTEHRWARGCRVLGRLSLSGASVRWRSPGVAPLPPA